MSEKYTKIFNMEIGETTEVKPISIEAGALLKDNINNKIIGQLKFKNNTGKIIKSLEINCTEIDQADNVLEDSFIHVYDGMSVGLGEVFGAQTPIHMKHNNTVKFQVEIKNVVYEENNSFDEELEVVSDILNEASATDELVGNTSINVGENKKKSKKFFIIPVVIVAILLLLISNISSGNKVYNDISWGMSPSDVQKKESGNVYKVYDGKELQLSYGYEEIFGVICPQSLISYTFANNKLDSIMIAITTYNSSDDFLSMSDNISKKFGDPDQEKGINIASGYITRTWGTSSEEVCLMIYSDTMLMLKMNSNK